jgi:hypothetical protein
VCGNGCCDMFDPTAEVPPLCFVTCSRPTLQPDNFLTTNLDPKQQ